MYLFIYENTINKRVNAKLNDILNVSDLSIKLVKN